MIDRHQINNGRFHATSSGPNIDLFFRLSMGIFRFVNQRVAVSQ